MDHSPLRNKVVSRVKYYNFQRPGPLNFKGLILEKIMKKITD